MTRARRPGRSGKRLFPAHATRASALKAIDVLFGCCWAGRGVRNEKGQSRGRQRLPRMWLKPSVRCRSVDQGLKALPTGVGGALATDSLGLPSGDTRMSGRLQNRQADPTTLLRSPSATRQSPCVGHFEAGSALLKSTSAETHGFASLPHGRFAFIVYNRDHYCERSSLLSGEAADDFD
jgi:hypothetical protein